MKKRGMKRDIALLTLCLAMLAGPALATHIDEPQAPVTGTYLQVLHYANPQVIVPCHETSFAEPFPFPFVGARIRMFVDTDGVKPGEHFLASLRVEKAVIGPQGGFLAWEKQWSVQWKHSNVPPHTQITPEGTPWGGMWMHSGDNTNVWYREPGIYKVQTELRGDESGNRFVDECYVEVPEGAAG